MEKENKITDRILQYIKFKGITKYKSHKDLGFSNAFLDTSRDISTDKYAKILEYLSKINQKWLLTGKGNMLDINIYPERIYKSEREKKNRNNHIPLIDFYSIDNFLASDCLIKEENVKDYYSIPNFKNIDFMIEIRGLSMFPTYNNGDIIACNIIKDNTFYQWNKIHIISTKEQGVLVKRIKKGSDCNTITLISDNLEYDPFEILKEEIIGIAIVICGIKIE